MFVSKVVPAAMALVVVAGCASLTTTSPSVDEAPRAVKALTWTPSSLDQDWPVPLRAEPSGDVVVVPMVQDDIFGLHADPRGDIGPGARPWLDIETVRVQGGIRANIRHGIVWFVDVDLAGDMPLPVPDPRERWIAYGLVVDTNGDGVPDVRLGMDNMPVTEPGHRAWRTVLSTGETMSAAGGPYGLVGDRYVDTFFPGEETGDLAELGVGLRARDGETTFRFYAWASLIEDGRVVATDYAPDLGWLESAAEVDP